MLVRANAEKQSFSKTKAPKRGFVLWAQLDLNQRPGVLGDIPDRLHFCLTRSGIMLSYIMNR